MSQSTAPKVKTLGIRIAIDVDTLPKKVLKAMAKAIADVMTAHTDVDSSVLQQCASYITSKPAEEVKTAAGADSDDEHMFDSEVVYITTVKLDPTSTDTTSGRMDPRKKQRKKLPGKAKDGRKISSTYVADEDMEPDSKRVVGKEVTELAAKIKENEKKLKVLKKGIFFLEQQNEAPNSIVPNNPILELEKKTVAEKLATKEKNDALLGIVGASMMAFIGRIVAFADKVKRNNPTAHPVVAENPAVSALTQRLNSAHADSQLTQRQSTTTELIRHEPPEAGVVKVFFWNASIVDPIALFLTIFFNFKALNEMDESSSVYHTVATSVNDALRAVDGIVPQFTSMLNICARVGRKKDQLSQGHVYTIMCLYSKFVEYFVGEAIDRLQAAMKEKKEAKELEIKELEGNLERTNRTKDNHIQERKEWTAKKKAANRWLAGTYRETYSWGPDKQKIMEEIGRVHSKGTLCWLIVVD